jgi:hypothetical protein
MKKTASCWQCIEDKCKDIINAEMVEYMGDDCDFNMSKIHLTQHFTEQKQPYRLLDQW